MSTNPTGDSKIFRDGIMKLNGHQFGRAGEVIVETLMGYTRSENPEFDSLSAEGQRIEVKTARVQEGSNVDITVGNFYDVAMGFATWDRLITQQKAANGSIPFACSMHGIKPLLFDRLFYLLVFKDLVEVFAIDSDVLTTYNPNVAYTGRHLLIDGETYLYHKSNHLVQSISYGDLMEVAKAKKSQY